MANGVAPLYGYRGFPVIDGIDANGCPSYPYELAASSGISRSFFAGTDFRPGIHAFEYSTPEITELIDGHQLIAVTNPTTRWRQVYAGYDVCTKQVLVGGAIETTCIAPAVVRLADDWVGYVPLGIIVAALLLFIVHFMRPAGPIRRRRHFKFAHASLMRTAATSERGTVHDKDVRQLQRRLRRLERMISSELSDSQHHWFKGLVTSGKHGLALESIARWLAESRTPVPDHVRTELLWLASSINVEHMVRPIVDAPAQLPAPLDVTLPVATGFDVSTEEFERLVAEAVDSLPEELGRAMSNVAVVVEEEGELDGKRLFGLYQGYPLTQYRFLQWSLHPDKITIYRRPICMHSSSLQEVRARIYRTVVHEIAHHFGIDDPRLRELGW